jgi:hypothetical protein
MVLVYDPSHFDRDSWGPVARILAASYDEAFAVALAEAKKAEHPFAVNVRPDPDFCETLGDYIAVENIQADVLTEFAADDPEQWKSEFCPSLIASPSYWGEMFGISTPRQMAIHLGAMADREAEKSLMAQA